MFTGIIERTGEVVQIESNDTDAQIRIAQPIVAKRLSLGASVAVDGVCLTVVERDEASFAAQAMAETLRVTTLGGLALGDRVNLELPLAAGEPLGGHVVQGHVDEVGRIMAVEPVGDGVVYSFGASPELVLQLVPKGSVAIDGISLTVGPDPGVARFEVYLIPHTLAVTTLGRMKPGDRVNLEVDILAKYVRRYLERAAVESGFDWGDFRTAMSRALEGDDSV